jgi:hypothetical protein
MPPKQSINERPPTTIYLLATIDGREHQITQDNFNELRPLITKGETYGLYIANENTDSEIIVFMRHIVSIRKERRSQEVIV